MARGRDRTEGRGLSMGWDQPEDSSPGSPVTQVPAPSAPAPSGPAPSGPGQRGAATSSPSVRRRRLLIALGAAAALVLALLVGLPRLGEEADGPEEVAQGFLQSLVDGDLDAVRSHASTAEDSSSAALTAEVLGAATDRVRGFEILDVERDAGTATVTASLDSGTAQREVTMSLTATSAGAFSPVRWEIVPVELPEVQLSLPMGTERIEVNGIPLDVHDLAVTGNPDAPRATLQLLPGTYDFSVPVESTWLQSSTGTITVPPLLGTWRKPFDLMGHEMNDAGTQEVESLVDAALQVCLESTAEVPGQCPRGLGDGVGGWTPGSPLELRLEPVGDFLWIFSGTLADAPGGASEGGIPFAVEGFAYLLGSGDLRVELGLDRGFAMGYCVDAETGDYTGFAFFDDDIDSREVDETDAESCG